MTSRITKPQRWSDAFEASEDVGRNPSPAPTIGDVIAARYSRRDMLKGTLGATAIAAVLGPQAVAAAHPDHAKAVTRAASAFAFPELPAEVTASHAVAEGYDADLLIRWGDPVLPGAPAFDPLNQSAEAQAQQFGYNNDYIGAVPHPDAPEEAGRALLVVNHEYTNSELMFPAALAGAEGVTQGRVDVEMAAHGGTVLEIRRGPDGKWAAVTDSAYNRRIHVSTPMKVSGPAAGHAKMKTSADPAGTDILGTLNNCAGGITPWGTWLMAEENFHGYFRGEAARAESEDPVERLYARYGVPGNWYAWGQYYDRFDTAKEPNEPHRFGWMVEVDPADPASTPIKRTALGRMKHEGGETVVNPDGRVVLFMGDDERFEYVYRFVTEDRYDPDTPSKDMLDRGTLSVARYDADGSVAWLPLIFGQGPLTPENGFDSQGDVLIQTRRAADLLGATPMDRPEDVEPNVKRGTVYAMLTNNTRRQPDQVDAANPRPANAFGHIIEMTAPGGDFAADRMTWEILVRCGDPSVAEVGATFSSATSADGWFGMPDNCAVDARGRLWVATDGNAFDRTGRTDGLWAVDTEGPARGTSRHFFSTPIGAELCGPYFLDDGTALVLAVQHPGDGGEEWPDFARPSTFADPSTRWPDFEDGVPPRPSVVVITKKGGGRFG